MLFQVKLDTSLQTQTFTESQQVIEDILTSLDASFTQEIQALRAKRRALREFESQTLLEAWYRLKRKSMNRQEAVKTLTELILAELN